jgi:hypothetical protein
VIPLYDRAIAPCRKGGFNNILLRGDTDFSLTTEFVRHLTGRQADPGLDAELRALAPDMTDELER